MLRILYASQADKVTEKWRKLHKEKLYNLNSSHSIIGKSLSRKVISAEHVARLGETRNKYKIVA
jgi:hypothetical protein